MDKDMRLKSVRGSTLVDNANITNNLLRRNSNSVVVTGSEFNLITNNKNSSVENNNSNTNVNDTRDNITDSKRPEVKWKSDTWDHQIVNSNYQESKRQEIAEKSLQNNTEGDQQECENENSWNDISTEEDDEDLDEEEDEQETNINQKRQTIRSFVNPNYPGFQHLAHTLTEHQEAFDEEEDNNNNNINNDNIDERKNNEENEVIENQLNKLNSAEEDKDICKSKLDLQKKDLYEKPKLNITLVKEIKEINISMAAVSPTIKTEQIDYQTSKHETNDNLQKREHNIDKYDIDNPTDISDKKEKTERNLSVKLASSMKTKKSLNSDNFDVYNIETAMPNIDLEAIENHLKAAREEERKRRNDREEIRRRLATGCDTDDYYSAERRPGKKPSLQSRLQSGMNLQICFMNETMSDNESPGSDNSPPASMPAIPVSKPKIPQTESPRSLSITQSVNKKTSKPVMETGIVHTVSVNLSESVDFFTKQARLQAEARQALAQAKDIARMQMLAERRKYQTSPITDMLRNSLHKVGIKFPEGRRRVNRQMLTDMNVAQLQVIVNDLHTQIEKLNEELVKYLMERDELHMGQDSMLVDIEDLTRYLGAKENILKEDLPQNNNNSPINNNSNNNNNNNNSSQIPDQQQRLQTLTNQTINQNTSNNRPAVISRIVNLGKK